MRPANARQIDRARRYEATADSSGSLDDTTRGRVQLVCDFVSAEVSRWRTQLVMVGAGCFVGILLLPIVTPISDVRIPIVVVAGVLVFWFVRARRELASSYDRIALKRLVAATTKGITYKPVSSLTREEFVSVDLYPAPGKGWRSRHEIGGHAGNAAFSLHAVHAPGPEKGAVAFEGVIIRLDFSLSFPGHTVVVSESAGQTAASASGAKRDLVLVKNPAFEQMFSAYSTDYVQARKLLTPQLMDFILTASEAFGRDLRLAFVRRWLFVAVPGVTLFPEVALFGSPPTPESAVGSLVRLLALAGGFAKAFEAS